MLTHLSPTLLNPLLQYHWSPCTHEFSGGLMLTHLSPTLLNPLLQYHWSPCTHEFAGGLCCFFVSCAGLDSTLGGELERWLATRLNTERRSWSIQPSWVIPASR